MLTTHTCDLRQSRASSTYDHKLRALLTTHTSKSMLPIFRTGRYISKTHVRFRSLYWCQLSALRVANIAQIVAYHDKEMPCKIALRLSLIHCSMKIVRRRLENTSRLDIVWGTKSGFSLSLSLLVIRAPWSVTCATVLA